MSAQMESIAQRLEAMRRRLHALADATPEERWGARRHPERWSVAECVAHLNLTARAYVPILQAAIAEARALGTPAPGRYRMDPVGWIISRAAGPLPRIAGARLGRARTPAGFVPTGPLPRAELLDEFDRLQDQQIELAHAADGLPIDRVKIASPFDPRARYNAYAAFVIQPRHQERHLIQAEEVWRG